MGKGIGNEGIWECGNWVDEGVVGKSGLRLSDASSICRVSPVPGRTFAPPGLIGGNQWHSVSPVFIS